MIILEHDDFLVGLYIAIFVAITFLLKTKTLCTRTP